MLISQTHLSNAFSLYSCWSKRKVLFHRHLYNWINPIFEFKFRLITASGVSRLQFTTCKVHPTCKETPWSFMMSGVHPTHSLDLNNHFTLFQHWLSVFDRKQLAKRIIHNVLAYIYFSLTSLFNSGFSGNGAWVILVNNSSVRAAPKVMSPILLCWPMM